MKWDHNRDLTTAGLADGSPGYRAQVHAAYALMARLRAAHPQVEIESCSGGGGRIDFAVLRHSHRVWTSDCIDALSRVDIQRGFLQFFPPEIMGAHIGTSPAHTTGRSQSMGFRAAVALPGHLGVELDARLLEEAPRSEVAHWIALYKRWRDRLHHGRVWLGEAGDGLVWQAHGDAEANELLLFVYRMKPSDHRYAPAVRLPMIDALARYRILRVLPEGRHDDHWFRPPAPLFDAIDADGVTFDGAWLANAGLPTPRSAAESCLDRAVAARSHDDLRSRRASAPASQCAHRSLGAGVTAPRQAPLAGPPGGCRRERRASHDPTATCAPATPVSTASATLNTAAPSSSPTTSPRCSPTRRAAVAGDPLFESMPARGTSRVICFSPDHAKTLPELHTPGAGASHRHLVRAEHQLGSRPRLGAGVREQGRGDGLLATRIRTARSGPPSFLPERSRGRRREQRAYFARHRRPLLLDVAQREAGRGVRVVVQSAHWLAVVPFWATWPFETLLLPRFAVQRLPQLNAAQRADLADVLKQPDDALRQPVPLLVPVLDGLARRAVRCADAAPWQLHAHFYPPLLRSATVRKFMVGFEMLAEAQRDLTPEQAAETPARHAAPLRRTTSTKTPPTPNANPHEHDSSKLLARLSPARSSCTTLVSARAPVAST